MPSGTPSEAFARLVGIVARLRGPDGCPWDREQTPKSAAPYLIEEAHEAAAAIDTADAQVIKEELGDLLLQVVFQAQLVADTSRAFTIGDVIASVTEKLIRRHPHVFGTTKVAGTEEVLVNWEKIKRAEKPAKASILDGLPKTLPALVMAYRLGQKASRAGFDWGDVEGILLKVEEEAREWHAARQGGDADLAEREFGDFLFTLANLARFLKLDPEGACRRAAGRFTQRFQRMEATVAERGRALNDLSAAEWDALWTEAKQWTAEK